MILVTGANGMMGRYVARAMGESELLLAGRDVFDVCNLEQGDALFAKTKPKKILHLAAETDVDLCEREPDHAYRTNVVGTQNVARLAAKYGAELVYVSTTSMFDGEKAELYTEFDVPNPLNTYAMTKYSAETIALRICPRSYVLRAGWVFGGGPKLDKKFAGKIVSLCRDHDEIRVVNDKHGSPTYAFDFLKNVRVIMDSGFYGTYNLVNRGSCTRYVFACEIVKIMGFSTSVVAVSSGEFPASALRPRSDACRNYHLELLGLDRMRAWQDALKEYLADWPAPGVTGA